VPAIGPRTLVGYCNYCNRWLGVESLEQGSSPNDSLFEEQITFTEMVGEMLATASLQLIQPQREHISWMVHKYIQDILDGNAKALAVRMGMNHRSIYEIRDGTQLPQLRTLLKFCRLAGISPLKLLSENTDEFSFNTRKENLNCMPSTQSKRNRKFDKEYLRERLEAIIATNYTNPPSMAQVARSFGYDQSFLARHLPEQCRQISQRFADHRAYQKVTRIERYCDLVRETTRDIHAHGLYPSYKRVSKVVRGLFKEPSVRQAYLETMRELGYR
jgi:AraC-like DNA-binding protein